MPTPEQQKVYTLLSHELQVIGLRHYKELPKDSVSLALTIDGGKVLLRVYDKLGKQIGTVPNSTTSRTFRTDLENVFLRVSLPDENVIAIL